MDRKQIRMVLGHAAALLICGLAVGCGPLTGAPKMRAIENVPTQFQCARALVDEANLPLSQVTLTGEPTIDTFLYEAAQLHAFSLVIERVFASMNDPALQAAMGVDLYACAGKEIQQAIPGLTQTGESLLKQAPAAASLVDDYCRAHPLSCISLSKRLGEATNQLRGTIQSLSRSSAQAGRLFAQTVAKE